MALAAFPDLLERSIDKPREQEIEIRASNEVVLLERLDRGRLRVRQPIVRDIIDPAAGDAGNIRWRSPVDGALSCKATITTYLRKLNQWNIAMRMTRP